MRNTINTQTRYPQVDRAEELSERSEAARNVYRINVELLSKSR